MNMIKRFITEEDGANLTEYAMLVALIAVFLVTALTGVRGALANLFTSIQTSIAAM